MLTVAVLFAASTITNAQFIVSGQFGIGGNSAKSESHTTILTEGKTTTTDVTEDPVKTFEFGITPRIGYQLNEKMSFGLDFGFGTRKTTDPTYYSSWGTEYKGEYTTTATKYGVGLFFRYSLLQKGDFSLWVEANPYFGKETQKINEDYTKTVGNTTTTTKREHDGPELSHVGIEINPGISYKLNDKFDIEAYLGIFGLYFDQTTTKKTSEFEAAGVKTTNEVKDTKTSYGLSINNGYNVAFGVVYHF